MLGENGMPDPGWAFGVQMGSLSQRIVIVPWGLKHVPSWLDTNCILMLFLCKALLTRNARLVAHLVYINAIQLMLELSSYLQSAYLCVPG